MPNDPYNSYVPYQKPQIMEARRSPFMHPSCLEAHATPRHESGDRAPCNPPSTRQHPPTPATAPGSPAVSYSEYTHAHDTKEEKRRKDRVCLEKGRKQRPVGRVRKKVMNGGGFEVGALRGQGCTNRARAESEI